MTTTEALVQPAERPTTRVLPYVDLREGARGWLVYDGLANPLSAGGCRVQAGLTAATLSTLASRMTLKQRVLGTRVDGAKCGIDLDPRSPAKRAVLGRFLAFLVAELDERLSLGCDMGTTWVELETLAAAQGVRSIKYSVRRAQGLDEDDFMARLRVLDQRVGALTVGERRAGHALAHAALAVLGAQGRASRPSCVIQGFGTLGRAAAYSLVEAGVRVLAVSDEHGCIADGRGLDVSRMLMASADVSVPEMSVPGCRLPREAVFEVPADAVVLAAGSDGLPLEHAVRLDAGAVVVGANCGVSSRVERLLGRRGVPVVPDFIGGIGGSASMEALFGPARCPEPAAVLRSLGLLMRELIADLVDRSRRGSRTLGEAALDVALTARPAPDGPPYGASPYLPAGGRR